MFRPETTAPSLSRGQRWSAEILSTLYMAAVAATAGLTGIATILFPELGAITHDVLARPWGKWASQPVRLIITPVLTAVVGTIATRYLPYHVLTILLIVCTSLAIIRLLRSAIAPAISAGVLPLVLGMKSWLYAPGIAAGVVVLVGMVVVWRRLTCDATGCGRGRPASRIPPELESQPGAAVLHAEDVDDVLESEPHGGLAWLVALLAFVAIMGTAAQVTGLRFILFPPLIVIAYEMFGHPETCPWAKRPMSLPVACGLTALGGIALVKLFGPGAAAAALAMAWGVLLLRLFDVHMPPALAVGLIPLVVETPTWMYPVSVTIGTLALTIASLVFNRWARRSGGGMQRRKRSGVLAAAKARRARNLKPPCVCCFCTKRQNARRPNATEDAGA